MGQAVKQAVEQVLAPAQCILLRPTSGKRPVVSGRLTSKPRHKRCVYPCLHTYVSTHVTPQVRTTSPP